MAIDAADHLPAVGLEASRRVVAEPVLDVPVDRDAVVVIEDDELAEPERAGQRASLVADALHQAAVASEHVGVMVNHRMARPVELLGQALFGHRHAHRIGQALTQRSGGGLDARRITVLGVARRLGVKLAELLEVVDRELVASQMQ